jgi:hypothetical protein
MGPCRRRAQGSQGSKEGCHGGQGCQKNAQISKVSALVYTTIETPVLLLVYTTEETYHIVIFENLYEQVSAQARGVF